VTEVLLFHHALGRTPGFLEFAERVRAAGHTVRAPDLFEGMTFASIDEGVSYAREVGFDTIRARGERAAVALPPSLVYAGFSLGVIPAQFLAQTRAGAQGALLFSAAIPPSEFGGPWPLGVPLQVHMMESDPFVLEGDLDAARKMSEGVDGAELYLYPGSGHLFTDPTLPEYDPQAAGLVMKRVLGFLERVR
jgi:dienelactone hydrolase